jgi:hypothetical protein
VSRQDVLCDLIDPAASARPGVADVAGRDRPAAFGDRCGLGFQLCDDRVDVPTRLAHAVVQFVLQLLA